MEAIQAIYERRAVRSFVDRKVPREKILELLNAAVQAPSAQNRQPWAFVVIQDSALLRSYSARAKALLLAAGVTDEHVREIVSNAELDLFHKASTLVVICARRDRPDAAEECALAAQNLMIAAHALDLGTCPIGYARSFLNTPEVREELGIPAGYVPVFPIVVGSPRIDTAPMPRDDPQILCWKE